MSPTDTPSSENALEADYENVQVTQGASIALASFVAQPEVSYAIVLERPLFAPTRRPRQEVVEPEPIVVEPVPVPVEVVNVTREPSHLVLSGVLRRNIDGSSVLVVSNGTGEWFKLNDTVDGWEITEIGSNWITLTGEGKDYRLELTQ